MKQNAGIAIISFMEIESFECEVCEKMSPMEQMSPDFGIYNELFMCIGCAKIAARELLEEVLEALRAENIALRTQIARSIKKKAARGLPMPLFEG